MARSAVLTWGAAVVVTIAVGAPAARADPGQRWRPGFAMRVLSIRGTVERVRLGRDSSATGTVGVEERALAYLNQGWISARYTDLLGIGAGDEGIEGGLAVDAALGLRLPWPPRSRGGEQARHGPFLRVGARAHLLDRGHLLTSLVELPQAQLGYSLLAPNIHVDLGARAGVSLAGRYLLHGSDDAAPRKLGSAAELGGYAAIGVRPFRLDVEVSRVTAPGDLGPVDALSALLCSVLSPPTLCVKGELLRADVIGSSGATISSSGAYVGMSLGLGPAEWR